MSENEIYIVDPFNCDCGDEIDTYNLTEKEYNEGVVICKKCDNYWLIKT